MKILVCDDQERNCNNLVETIHEAIGGEEGTVKELTSTRLGQALTALFKDIRGFLQDSLHSASVESPFDNQEGLGLAIVRMTYIISINKNHVDRRLAKATFVEPEEGFSTTFEIAWKGVRK